MFVRNVRGLMKLLRRWASGFLPFFVVFVFWEAVVALKFFPRYILPAPHDVIALMIKLLAEGDLLEQSWISFQNALIGLFLGAILGLAISVACAFNRRVHDFFMPLVSAAYPVPTIIWVPLALLWFGFNSKSLIFVVALGSFFTMFYNMLIGLKSINPLYTKMARNLELGKWDYFREIIVFGSFPYLLSGLRLSMGWSWRIIIGAEMLAGTVKGLGWFLWISSEFFKYTEVFVGMLTIALIGWLSEKLIFEFLEKRTIKRWY